MRFWRQISPSRAARAEHVRFRRSALFVVAASGSREFNSCHCGHGFLFRREKWRQKEINKNRRKTRRNTKRIEASRCPHGENRLPPTSKLARIFAIFASSVVSSSIDFFPSVRRRRAAHRGDARAKKEKNKQTNKKRKNKKRERKNKNVATISATSLSIHRLVILLAQSRESLYPFRFFTPFYSRVTLLPPSPDNRLFAAARRLVGRRRCKFCLFSVWLWSIRVCVDIWQQECGNERRRDHAGAKGRLRRWRW